MINGFKCRICGAKGTYSSIIETELPLAADVTDVPKKNMKRFPIHVVRCGTCGHVQLRETLDSSFYGDYLYTPSFASGFSKYIDEFVRDVSDAVTKPNRKVIEIGSSNGYLLGKMQEKGWIVLGVEPSKKLSQTANEEGIKTFNGYFSEATVEEIKSIIGQPDVVIIRHVMEHLDSLNEIVKAIKSLLGNGLLLIEVPYLRRIVKEDQFYAFFHEHLSYYSVTALYNLLKKADLHIHTVVENDLEGGSILVSADSDGTKKDDDNVDEYLEEEKLSLSDESVNKFAEKIKSSTDHIKSIVSDAEKNGKTVAAWGAGQRGCTLIGMCGFQSKDIRYVVDVNKNYWNKYVPGTDIKIVPPEYCYREKVDMILIFATGYADSIISENKDYEESGGSFIRII